MSLRSKNVYFYSVNDRLPWIETRTNPSAFVVGHPIENRRNIIELMSK
jgi:hypothetical protein